MMDASEATEWLTLPDSKPTDLIYELLADSVSPADRNPVTPEGLPEKHKALVMALKRLSHRQRPWMRAFLESGGSKAGAARILKKQGLYTPDVSTVSRWMHSLNFVTALTLLKKHYADMSGVDRDSILLRAGAVLEDALTPKPVLFMGSPTGFEEIDGNVAMRAIEFAGKVNKMLVDDGEGPRVTLVVNIANRDDLERVDVVAEQ